MNDFLEFMAIEMGPLTLVAGAVILGTIVMLSIVARVVNVFIGD